LKKQRIMSLLLSLAMVFSLLPAGASAVNVKTFEDVSKDAWYYDYVKYVADKEYFVGTSKTTFSPEMPMTRAMFVTVLAAVEKVKVNNNVSPFADVPANTWYSGAVAWAAEKGVVAGVGDNKFAPDASITREQMAVMMNAYIKWTGNDHKEKSKVESFKDADKISSWAKDAVEACRNWGLVAGMPDGNFWPANTASRAEVATVIKNLAFMVYGGGGGGGDDYTDYIKAAVEKSVDIFNDKMPSGAAAYGSSIALSDMTMTGQNLAVTGTVTANAETIEDMATFAVSKAAEIIGALSAGTSSDQIIADKKAEIAAKAEAVADDIIAKLNGFFGTSLELDNLNKASIKENIKAAYENGVEFGKNAWNDAFMVDGKVVTGDIVVSVGDAEVTVEVDGANLSIEGKATDAVKTLAVAIAKDLYAQLIDVDDKTAVTAIDPSVEVGILFSAGEYAEDTNEFPYAYTLTLTADLEGSAANNIEYWYDKTAKEHNVNLVVSEKMTEMYEGYAEQIVSQVTALAMDKAAETVTNTSVSIHVIDILGVTQDVTAPIVSALPSTLNDILNDAATNPNTKYKDYSKYAETFLALDPAVQEYAKNVILDQLLVDAGLLNEGESHFVQTEAPAMDITEMKDLANDLGVDTSKYDSIINKVEKLQDPAYIKTLTLGDLASAIETLDDKGMVPEIVDKFVKLVDMLPESASVTVQGKEVISKAALAGDDAVEIVVAMLNKVGNLNLASFESGVKVKVEYDGNDAVVNFFINN